MQVQNISGDDLFVPYADRVVEAGEWLEVAEEDVESFVHQETNWFAPDYVWPEDDAESDDAGRGEAVNAETGVVTPPGQALPPIEQSDGTPLDPPDHDVDTDDVDTPEEN